MFDLSEDFVEEKGEQDRNIIKIDLVLFWKFIESLSSDRLYYNKQFVEFWQRFKIELVFSDILLCKRRNVIGGNCGIFVLFILLFVRFEERI